MVSHTYKNWLYWSYNDVPYTKRQSKSDKYKFHYNLDDINSFNGSYKDALFESTKLIRDTFNEPLDILLSGGIDSEVVVRCFKSLGIKHNTYIFKYEKNYNTRDVLSAVEICKSLNIKYKIINFELEKFFNNEAYDIFKQSSCIKAPYLPHLKFIDLVDNIPVMGNGEPYWKRNNSDYTFSSEWLFPLHETHHNPSMYCRLKGRNSVCDFYEFTPFVIKCYNQLSIVHKLLTNRLVGKLSNWSSRIPIHREIWPEIKDKVKLTGYEGENFPGKYPEFINDMQDQMTKEIGNGDEYWLNQYEVEKIFSIINKS